MSGISVTCNVLEINSEPFHVISESVGVVVV